MKLWSRCVIFDVYLIVKDIAKVDQRCIWNTVHVGLNLTNGNNRHIVDIYYEGEIIS
jgi:hypothetical protein